MVEAGANHLADESSVSTPIGLKQVQVLPVGGMIANRGVATFELHWSELTLAAVAERTVGLPLVFVSPVFAAGAGENENHWVVFRRTYSALPLATILVVKSLALIGAAEFKHAASIRQLGFVWTVSVREVRRADK